MTVTLQIREGLAFVGLNAPPVNSLGLALRRELVRVFKELAQRGDVQAVVLHGVGRGFCAGGDVSEFGTPAAAADPGLSLHVHPAIEDCGKPVVAAAHGFLIGGGLETALACHGRVAEVGTKVALPEGKLGIIPLAATQRLPRLLGLAASFDLMLSGRTFFAEQQGAPLFDRVVAPGGALAAAAELARELATHERPARLADLPPPRENTEAILAAIRRRLSADAAPVAAWRLLDALTACVEAATFEEGMARAREIHDALKNAPEVKGAREAFFASRA